MAAATVCACAVLAAGPAGQRPRPPRRRPGPDGGLTQVLGRPTDRSVALSVLPSEDAEVYAEYGSEAGSYSARTPVLLARAGEPLGIDIGHLKPDTRYFYRLRDRTPGGTAFREGQPFSFHTQRAPGRSFTFALQGDSHPERAGRMFDAALYRRTLDGVRNARPDFYVLMGDDFSIDPLIARGDLTQAAVDDIYREQRHYLSAVGSTAPLFLVNGNHEQAAGYLLRGTADSPPLLAGRARNRFFPLPAPDHFYSGNTEPIEGLGLPRDYYAWTWGDALFLVIDPYWHSPVQVDAAPGGGGRRGGGQGSGGRPAGRQGSDAGGRARDWWGITIGDAQYRWLKTTLEQSRARYKFVFAHHVMGTGRGGVEEADLYEWGGKDRNGIAAFAARRPGWELPIHQLMAKAGVTIFFQGHDHLFARQEKDGVVYQEVPNPADPSYTAFNEDAYRSGDRRPNSGYLRVTVAPESATVEYVRVFLPGDEHPPDRVSGMVAFTYTRPPRR